MLKTIFAIIAIGIASKAGAAEPAPTKVFATEGFVRSGLATKPSASDVASAIAAAVGGYIPTNAKGAANGVATLDAGGKVPTAQIPAISYNNLNDKPSFPNGNDYLPLVGGTMTGALTLSGAPTNNLHAATKAYVDSATGGSGVTSATSPSSCSSYSYVHFGSEGWVNNCSGGSVNGAAVSYFSVGGYCSSTAGQGNYSNPQVQTCGTGDSNCYAAPSAETTVGDAGDKRYCYCKIHSINGTAVVASSRFVFDFDYGGASSCAYVCAYSCADDAQVYSGFRSALFSALGG